jgi:hypothetical protein
MIEIIDKINNTVRQVVDDLEIVVDPAGIVFHVKDYQLDGQRIFGIIHKEDGSTLFCYQKTE